MRAWTAGAAAGAMTALWGVSALAQTPDNIGQPTNGAIDLQPGVTPLRHDAIFFHNAILLPIITAITLFVLALLIWIVVRYNKRANPVPAKWSHNTPIEVIWTDIPDPHTPMGAHGIGEIGITGTAAAIANAVYNATGKRIRDLPITLDKLM